MTMYHFPVTPERDRAIRTRVAEKVRERSDANFEALNTLPGHKEMSGRQKLAFYLSTDDAYWLRMAGEFPQVARAMALEFGHLLQEYG